MNPEGAPELPNAHESVMEKMGKEAIEKLGKFLHDWSNEIPEEILHGGGKFKVRLNWWMGVCGNLAVLLQTGFIKDEMAKQECENFLHKYTKTQHWGVDNSKRTAKEDIDEANALLEKVVKLSGSWEK